MADGDYYGSAVNRTARLRAIARGGQTVLSGATWELVADSLPEGISAQDLGEHRLKDLTRPVFTEAKARGTSVDWATTAKNLMARLDS